MNPPSRRPPRVALFGLFGIGNFGNEASLTAAIEAVRRAVPDAVLSAIGSDPPRVTALHGVPTVDMAGAGWFDRFSSADRWVRLATRPMVEVARFARAVRYLRGVELVLVPGTGILDDFGQGPGQLPLDVWRWSLAARVARRPLVYLSIGAGPIAHPLSRRLMRGALAQAQACSYRDEVSRRYMASIGRRVDDDEVWPDLVFALRRPSVTLRTDPAPLTVALGVMDYRGWRGVGDGADEAHARYVGRVVELTGRLRARGLGVRLVVGDDADVPVAQQVLATVADPAVELVPSAAFDDVLAALAGADVMIASRYHNLVAALVAGLPAVSVSYAAKNEDLLASAGLADRAEKIDSFDLDRVEALLDDVLAHRVALAHTVRERTEALRSAVTADVERCLERFLA